METLNKMRPLGYSLSFLLLIAGVICIFDPYLVLDFLSIISGIVLIGIGLFKVFQFMKQFKLAKKNYLHLWVSILFIVPGFYAFFKPSLIELLFGILLGLLALYLSFDRFYYAYKNRKKDLSKTPALFMGLVHLLFCVFLIYTSVVWEYTVMLFFGIYLVFIGISFFLSLAIFKDF